MLQIDKQHKGHFLSTLVSTTCNLDSGLCDGWKQSNSDVFDWTLNTGSTPSSNTGPDYDHTGGSGKKMLTTSFNFLSVSSIGFIFNAHFDLELQNKSQEE